MAAVPVAIAGSSVLGGGLGLAGGKAQAKAANRASDIQLQAAREAIAAQKENTQLGVDVLREQFAQARKDLQPFRDVSLQALQQAQQFTQAGSPLEIQNREQAQKAISNRLSAQGLGRSGAQGAALANLETGLLQNRFNNTLALAGGPGGAGALSNLDTQLGASLAGLYGGLGQGIGTSLQQGAAGAAQGLFQAGAAQSSQLSGFNNAFQGGLANFLSYQNQQNNQALLARQNALLANSPLFGGGGQ